MRRKRAVLAVARTKRVDAVPRPYNHTFLEIMEDLSSTEYDRYSAAVKAINEFEVDVQLHTMVESNYNDYYDTLGEFREAYTRHGFIDAKSLVLNINRRMLNLLASVRTYLDHTETSIKRKYGKDSENLHAFKEVTGEAYDLNFSYRLLYELRNFAQHVGLPVGAISYGKRAVAGDWNKVVTYMEARIDRDQLLASVDWNKSKKLANLKRELEAQPPKIDVDLHLAVMMRCLGTINTFYIQSEFKTLSPHAEFIKGLLQRMSNDDGEPGVYECDLDVDETGKVINRADFRVLPFRMDIVDAAVNNRIGDITTVKDLW